MSEDKDVKSAKKGSKPHSGSAITQATATAGSSHREKSKDKTQREDSKGQGVPHSQSSVHATAKDVVNTSHKQSVAPVSHSQGHVRGRLALFDHLPRKVKIPSDGTIEGTCILHIS